MGDVPNYGTHSVPVVISEYENEVQGIRPGHMDYDSTSPLPLPSRERGGVRESMTTHRPTRHNARMWYESTPYQSAEQNAQCRVRTTDVSSGMTRS